MLCGIEPSIKPNYKLFMQLLTTIKLNKPMNRTIWKILGTCLQLVCLLTVLCGCGKEAEKETTPSGGNIPVQSVSLNHTTLTLEQGQNSVLQATVYPSNATNPAVQWKSDNTSVATVDNNGKVTAVTEGSATVTAKAGDKTATCTVTVKKKVVPIESVTLNKTTLTLAEGDSETLTAAVNPDNATDKTVTWSSSKTSVATVDNNGKVTAVAEGSATVTAKAGDKTATCTVTVKKKVVPIESVTLNKTTLTLAEGDSETLTATVNPDNATDKTVTWSSSKTSVATVDNGKITAIAEGTATITAKAGEKTATCTVTVKKKVVPVESVTLNKTALTLTEGDSETLTATVNPDNATDKTVTWSSSKTSVATVDNGKITAIAEGTATITAKAGEKTATCTVTVKKKEIPVSSISISYESLTLEVGTQKMLTATVTPDNATYKTVNWASSNTSVATVDANGKITAIKAGTTTITAKAGDKSASCIVTVTQPVTSVTLNTSSLILRENETAQLIATVGPQDATDKTVTWTSSNPAIVSVDGNGQIKAISLGNATVTAKAGDVSATCEIKVTNDVAGGSEGFGEEEWD